jgi:hypothetical protein
MWTDALKITFNFIVFTLVLHLCCASACEMIVAYYETPVTWKSMWDTLQCS